VSDENRQACLLLHGGHDLREQASAEPRADHDYGCGLAAHMREGTPRVRKAEEPHAPLNKGGSEPVRIGSVGLDQDNGLTSI